MMPTQHRAVENEPASAPRDSFCAIASLRRRLAMRRVFSPALTMSLFMCSASAWAQSNACDLVSPFGTPDPADVQAAINMSLGVMTCPSTINIAGPGVCNVVFVQRVVNASLGGPCVTPTTHGVTLTWTASTSANVAGYNVYRATTSGGPYSKVNPSLVAVLTYNDSAVQAGVIYYYVVTAVDTSNNESGYSTQVQAKIPNP
jgi:hypothetical protein